MSREVSGGRKHLPYLSETTSECIVRQEGPFSCVVTCCRQLLIDAGQPVSERDLAGEIPIFAGVGSDLVLAGKVLSQRHPVREYAAGSVDPDNFEALMECAPWIARVKLLTGNYHCILIDRIEGHVLTVRDPLGPRGSAEPFGSVATIDRAAFLKHWRFGLHAALFALPRTKGHTS